MDLAEAVYLQTAEFPLEERYALNSQLRRAAVSVPSNIAEGQGRRMSNDDFVRFLRISLGSLCELETQIELAFRLKLMNATQAAALRPMCEEVGRIVNGLIKSKQH